MPANRTDLPPIIALTQDGLALSHVEQTRALIAAGVSWIQLRMKTAAPDAWLATAREVVALCREAHVLCTINDNVDIALATNADGVHLGKLDEDWTAARARLGPDKLLGGTVNNAADARRAAASDVLDYAGIGPLRFTTTKQNLAPVLGLDGIAALLPLLGGLPAWVIGSVQPADLAPIRAIGAAGIAVCSPLYATDNITANYHNFTTALIEPV